MEHYGFLLKQIRLKEKLSIKKAATRIGKSAGWLSEVENGKGNSRIDESDFNELVIKYDGLKYKPKFGAWLTHAQRYKKTGLTFEGVALRHFRLKKGLSQRAAARLLKFSSSYLSMIENGYEKPSISLKKNMLELYGQSEDNFSLFLENHKKSDHLPATYKIKAIIKRLGEPHLKELCLYAANLLNASTDRRF